MDRDRSGLDRLLKRHPLGVDVPIRWDVHTVHRLIGKDHEEFVGARIIDISMEGALIEVPMPTDKVVGDRVLIEFDTDQRGVVGIRHSRVALSGDRMLFGVRFEFTGSAFPALCELVDRVSGRSPQMLHIWNTAR